MKVRTRRHSRGVLERTTDRLRLAVERVSDAEHAAGAAGLLQQLDPRVKVAGLLALVVAATTATTASGIAAVLAAAVVMALASRLSIVMLASHVWLGALLFSGAIALPACVLTPGRALFRLPALGWPVTHQGVATAAYLVLRVEAAATLAALLVFTTRWTHVLRALRSLRVPVVFVVVLGMTYRYILLLLEAAHEMFESRRSRLVGELAVADRRRLATATAGVLMSRTIQLAGDVYLAMQARGFRGEVYVLDEFRMRGRDWLALAGFGALTVAAAWVGR